MLFKIKMENLAQNVLINVLKYASSNFASKKFGNQIRS